MLTGCTDLHRFRERVFASTRLLPYSGNQVGGTEDRTDQHNDRSSYGDEIT